MNLQESKYNACVQLSAIGDALGWITEFEKPGKSLEKKYGTNIIDRFYDWEKPVGGRFYGYIDKIKRGSYSDDTQLTLAIARSIKSDGEVDNEYFSKIELPFWLQYSRGGGRTVKTAASKIQRKSARWFSNFYNVKTGEIIVNYRDAGANGAAMRIYPIVLANLSNKEVIKKNIFSNSIITHGHPRAILSAIFFGTSLDTVFPFRADTFNPLKYLSIIGQSLHNELNLYFLDEYPFSSWYNEWNRESKTDFLSTYWNTRDELLLLMRIVYKAISENPEDIEVLQKLGCFNSESKSSGTCTVAAGIYFACKYFDNPEKAIIKAVNSLGTDTDSIAAFSGALLGALHGITSIPIEWKEIQDYAYLDFIASRLLTISSGELQPLSKNILSNSSFKSLDNITEDYFSDGDKIFFTPLGSGNITKISRVNTLTKGKYNLILEVEFEIGQSCVFSQVFNLDSSLTDNILEN